VKLYTAIIANFSEIVSGSFFQLNDSIQQTNYYWTTSISVSPDALDMFQTVWAGVPTSYSYTISKTFEL